MTIDRGNNTNNKRIAKNTLLMYVRMFITMCVGLYTSRIVLATLGFQDFGLYNVVGGVIAMFSFINGAMTNTISRFLTYHLGNDDTEKLKEQFSVSFFIQLCIAGIVVVLSECVGLWLLHYKMTIPQDRMVACEWVFHLSVISTFFLIVNVPYNALVIAHEKLSIFAYISIMDVFLKLLIIVSITYIPYDNLITYAALLCAVQILNIAAYRYYCICYFPESKICHCWNKQLIREMISFAGWSTFGNLFYLLYTQGVNIILNMFCGPIVNAARGITIQVESVVKQFASNVQISINPQIIKSYANNDINRMFTLICASSRYCFYLLFLMIVPVVWQIPYILHLWLGDYPEHTILFIRLTLVNVLLDTLINPMFTANIATGKVKIYHVVNSVVSVLFVPITYFTLKVTTIPESVFVCIIAMNLIGICTRFYIMKKQIGMGLRYYLTNVVMQILPVIFLSFVLISPIYLTVEKSLYGFVLSIITAPLCVALSVYLVGLNGSEKNLIIYQIRKKMRSIHVNKNL